MKKILCIVLSLCLLVGLCSCSNTPIKVKKFSSEEEMKAYVQGVWGYEKLYFIDGDQLYYAYSGAEGRVDSYNDSLADVVKEQGIEGVSKIVVKDHLAQIEKSWFSVGKTLQFDHKKGTITYVQDGVEEIIYVGENVIFHNSEIEKLSDTPSYTCDELIGTFEDAHKNFKPTIGMYRLNAKEYAEALRNKYPFATVTLETGIVKMERGFVEVNYGLKPNLLTVSDTKMTTGMEALVADALLVFGNAPDTPSAGELADRFYREGVTKTETKQIGSYSIVANTKTLVVDLDGVEIEMYQWRNYRNSSDGFDMVSVRF